MLRLINILEIKIMKNKYMIFLNALEKCILSNISTLEIHICIMSVCVHYYTLKDLRKFLGYTLYTVNAIENQANLDSQYEKIL